MARSAVGRSVGSQSSVLLKDSVLLKEW